MRRMMSFVSPALWYADPVWQPALDRGLDQGGSEEREREGHTDVALAAVLADSDVLHSGDGARLHLGEPQPVPAENQVRPYW